MQKERPSAKNRIGKNEARQICQETQRHSGEEETEEKLRMENSSLHLEGSMFRPDPGSETLASPDNSKHTKISISQSPTEHDFPRKEVYVK